MNIILRLFIVTTLALPALTLASDREAVTTIATNGVEECRQRLISLCTLIPCITANSTDMAQATKTVDLLHATPDYIRVVPSYNNHNQDWCRRNLEQIFAQEYSNFFIFPR